MSPCSEALRPLRNRRGQGLAELAICLPFLLLLALGILEVGRMIETHLIMSSLTREGANIASRGGTLAEALDVTRTNQIASGLGDRGGAVVSRVTVDGGIPWVQEQISSPGFERASRIGLPDSIATPLAPLGLVEGQAYFAVELFLPYAPITPFRNLAEHLVPETLYDRSVF